MKILILAANPKNTEKLRLDEEMREIQAGLERARKREQFEIIARSAVRPDDLRRALLDYEPQIVHFSGHGAGNQGLALEDNTGQAKLVSAESLARLFKLFKDKVECVLLNACYSEVQAEAIHQHVDYVIGMSQAIGDKAALEFAVGFYDALGAGRAFEDAYEFGRNAIDLEGIPEYLTPVLKSRTNLKLPSPNSTTIANQEQKQDKSANIPPNQTIFLDNPEGQVPLDSAFYIERPPIEADCYETILKPGALIRIKAPRQMGKSSLMMRILHHANEQDYQALSLNFQLADGKVFTDLKAFLQWFCASVSRKLKLKSKIEEYWDDIFGDKDNCTIYFEEYLLQEINNPLVLALDEVDLIFQHPEIATDFFGLLRAWHEAAKSGDLWKKLRLLVVHSQEVYIPLNINQSPFNVGLPIELQEFSQDQVQELVERHRLEWNTGQVEQLMTMVGGHPYLVRVALYHIARHNTSLKQLLQTAATEAGLYSDHLRRHLWNLEQNPKLAEAIKKVIATTSPVRLASEEAFKLDSMGLVFRQGNDVKPLCNLYRQFFRDRLGVS